MLALSQLSYGPLGEREFWWGMEHLSTLASGEESHPPLVTGAARG